MKLKICALMLCVSFLLTGCTVFHTMGTKNPKKQPGSSWISEDGRVSFVVEENGSGTGILRADDEEIEIYLGIGVSNIGVYYLENVSDNHVGGPMVESWYADFDKSDRFVVTVADTTYFEEWQTIVFNRVDE